MSEDHNMPAIMPNEDNRVMGGSASMAHIPELNGIRGFAIVLVLVWHHFQNQLWVTPGTPLAYIKQVLGFTWSGVDLFLSYPDSWSREYSLITGTSQIISGSFIFAVSAGMSRLGHSFNYK